MDTVKKYIEELKEVLISKDCSDTEKKLIRDFFIALKFQIQVKIISQIIIESENLKILLTSINNLMNEYQISLESTNDKILIGRFNSKIRRLKNIKNLIEDENYKSLIEEILINPKYNEQDIIRMCSLSLADGYKTFKKIFGDSIVTVNNGKYIINEQIVDNMFDIYFNRKMNKQIIGYVNLYLTNKKIEKSEQEVLIKTDLYSRFNKNSDLVRDYAKALIDYKKFYSLYHPFEVQFEQNKKIIDYIEQSTKYEKMLQIIELQNKKSENDILSNYLSSSHIQLSSLVTVLNSLQNKLREADLSSIIDEFSKRVIIKDGEEVYLLKDIEFDSVAQISSTIFKEVMTKKSDNLLDNLYNRLSLLRKKHDNNNEKIITLKEKMDESTLDLINNHLEECINLVKFESSERKFNVYPLLSAYILLTISKLKNVDFNDLNSMIEEPVDIEKLKSEYSILLDDKIDKKFESVDEIHNEVKPSIFNM